MQINLIAAVAKNLATGNNGKLPWHIPADLQRFKELTTVQAVIMGRGTWESLECEPLNERVNLVVSKGCKSIPLFNCPQTKTTQVGCKGIARAVEIATNTKKETFFIGGHGVWLESAKHATRLYLTVVDGEYDGDAFFPATLPGTWHETQREKHEGYSFCTLEKVSQDGEFSVQDYVKLA